MKKDGNTWQRKKCSRLDITRMGRRLSSREDLEISVGQCEIVESLSNYSRLAQKFTPRSEVIHECRTISTDDPAFQQERLFE